MIIEDLNERQRQFCIEYLKLKNATQAAKNAGYSAKTAESKGSQLLSNIKVRRFLDKRLAKIEQKVTVTAADVLNELAKVAMVNIKDAYLDDTGTLKCPNAMPDDIAHSVSQIEVNEYFEGFGDEKHQAGFTKKVKFHDKVRALEALAKHFKLLTDRTEVELSLKDKSDEELKEMARTLLLKEAK